MNDNQREMLTTCLTQVFGRVEDDFVDGLDPLLRWIDLPGGETLFSQGDTEDGVYFLISGRLRALVRDDNGQQRAISEMKRGETIGEMAVLTGEPRSATVVAIRDSVLAHVTRAGFDALTLRYPQLTVSMARLIVNRLRRSAQGRPVFTRPVTLCLLPITDGLDPAGFGAELLKVLGRWGVAALETSRSIDERMGAGTAQAPHSDEATYHKLTLWLDDVEFWHEYVLLVADLEDTEWTRRCLRQSDEVLLLARAEAPPRLHPLEEKHLAGPGKLTGAQQTLLLLHDGSQPHPTGTPAWLDRRPVHAHLHIRPALARDLGRLARILTGNAIGLVLAGGGARGFAHLGAYRALEEAGIAVDYVGGTSIGAAMGGYVAFDLPAAELIERARAAFGDNPTSDISPLPLLSLIQGRKLKRIIDRAVGDVMGPGADISDTWRTFFCVATNFSKARELVLTRGHLATCIRSSVSIPVALPPVILDGDLLMDGGSFNNFPTDVMAGMRTGKIIGVDLMREKTRRYDFPEVPGFWSLLLDSLRPYRSRKYKLPSLGAVLMDSTILYSASRQKQARQSVDIFLNPSLGRYGMLEWKAFEKIVELGYQQAKETLAKMSAEELAPYRD
jgi:NTE family protein